MIYDLYKTVAIYCLTKILKSTKSSITEEDALQLLTIIVESKGNKADAQLVKGIVGNL